MLIIASCAQYEKVRVNIGKHCGTFSFAINCFLAPKFEFLGKSPKTAGVIASQYLIFLEAVIVGL